MDGMYTWLQVCVEELNISEELLEGKIERLIDAMLLLYVHSLPSTTLFHISSHFSRGARPGPTSVTQPPQAETIIHEVLESDSPPLGILPPTSLDVRCPGYGLKMPHSQSPFVSYPFLLHSIKTLPWKVEVSDAQLSLRSIQCIGAGQVSKRGKEIEPRACHPCFQLHDDSIIMGIRHRSLAGAHENTPWAYLTAGEILSLGDIRHGDLGKV